MSLFYRGIMARAVFAYTIFARVDSRTPHCSSPLQQDSNPRVQTHAAAALVNFSECAAKELLHPYLDDLLGNVSPRLYPVLLCVICWELP